ncbi:MAG TPA: ABC transporter substrate-binding protein [Dehalococcoidia bacterium]|nr:ABC transporter substrate-binding protein [Dehalococcoidia bacterium]
MARQRIVRQQQAGAIAWRLSRRRLVRMAGGGSAALAAAAIGCDSSGKRPAPSGAGAARQPRKGGIISYAGGQVGSWDTQARSFDPMIQTQSGARSYTLFYERLLAYNLVTYEVEPELAQKWEQPSPTELLFRLQPGVRWQNKPPLNGRLMTTDDVLWSFQRAQTDDPKFYSRSLLTNVDKLEAPDSSTIKITTKAADASTLNKISTDNLAILSREVFEKDPKPTTADASVGTGAFLMKSVEENVGAEYVRNPDYWRANRPYLDGFRTRALPDNQSAWSAYLAGQIDVTLLDGPAAKTYVSQQGPGYSPAWGADDTIGAFMYPNTKVKPMDDLRVTRALRLLTDHDEWINTWALDLFGRGDHGSVFPPVLPAWDLTHDEYRSHLEWKQPKDEAAKEAISLLSAAGFSKDKPLKFTMIAGTGQQGQSETQLTQAQWKRLSLGAVDVDIKLLAQAEIDTARAGRSFTYGIFGHSAGPADPEIWLSTTYRSGGSLNFMGLSDPRLDAMIDKQRTIFDERQRKEAVKAIVSYMIDNSPSTIGANRYFLHATQPKVQGYQPETHYLNGRLFSSVWLSG